MLLHSATVQLEGGSFGSRRASAEFETGLLPSRFAMYGRVSALRTTGYRYHSGVEGRSLFLSGGYFGDRDIVKATLTTGTTSRIDDVSKASSAASRSASGYAPSSTA